MQFFRRYLIAIAVTVLFVEIGDDIWKWCNGYESATGLPWVTSLIHILSQTIIAFPFYVVLSFVSAAAPALLFYEIAVFASIRSPVYYAFSGVVTAFPPSLLMLNIVTGVFGRRAQVMFLGAHCLYGVVGGALFWWAMGRKSKLASSL